MNKRFYTDFSEHCMRFYATSPYDPPSFRSTADKLNWQACEKAMKEFGQETQKVLISLFREKKPLTDSVCDYCRRTGSKSDNVWYLIRDLERQIAKKRGLI